MKGRAHPSGKPKHGKRWVGRPIPRPPPDEPLTPGLRITGLASAVGFHADIIARDDEDEDEWTDWPPS